MAELEGQNPGGAGLVFAAHNNHSPQCGLPPRVRNTDNPGLYYQRPKTGLEPSRVVLYPFVQHSVRHGDPLERYGGRHDAPSLVSRHRLQTLGLDVLDRDCASCGA